ncbi:MAG TPA: response regulator transcription factor [Actinomycetota bacterium]|nr:response regulator transcription factor [Actinomycetota bacterium]
MRDERTIRVVLVDDHELVRRGLRDFLTDERDFDIVGEAATAADALEVVAMNKPDVAVLDVRLPDGNGIEVCREIRSRWPEVKCLILTSFADERALLNAVVAGASGYVLKETKTVDLVSDIRKLASGSSLIDDDTTRRLFDRIAAGATSGPMAKKLSPQEQRILALIAEGLSNREIAERLHLAEQTVKNYVSRLLGKLGVARRTQAAVLTARAGDEDASLA